MLSNVLGMCASSLTYLLRNDFESFCTCWWSAYVWMKNNSSIVHPNWKKNCRWDYPFFIKNCWTVICRQLKLVSFWPFTDVKSLDLYQDVLYARYVCRAMHLHLDPHMSAKQPKCGLRVFNANHRKCRFCGESVIVLTLTALVYGALPHLLSIHRLLLCLVRSDSNHIAFV